MSKFEIFDSTADFSADVDEDYYDERCENWVEIPEDDERYDGESEGTCGGKLKWISQRHYYNGHYDCITMTLECKHCGRYDVECV